MSWSNVIPAWMVFDFPKYAPEHVKKMIRKHTKKVLVSKRIKKSKVDSKQ